MSESEWISCDWPFDMLRHLEGKINDTEYMRFSVACCRRVWPLITDPRSRALIETTEEYLAGRLSADEVQPIINQWEQAYDAGEVTDRAGGNTSEAIGSACGVGFGHAAQVAKACFESVGYSATEALRATGTQQPKITAVWLAAEKEERLAQCAMLREMFGYLPDRA